jgi:hypothetical protein
MNRVWKEVKPMYAELAVPLGPVSATWMSAYNDERGGRSRSCAQGLKRRALSFPYQRRHHSRRHGWCGAE